MTRAIALAMLLLGGCASPLPGWVTVPPPEDCGRTEWDDRRGCVEIDPPGRITIPECCGRKPVQRR